MALSKDLIVFLGNNSHCFTYNVETKEFHDFENLPTNWKNHEFFDQFPSIINFNQIKAFVFTISDPYFLTSAENYEYRLKCREFSEKFGIFYYFNILFQDNALTAISQTKTMVKDGEEILFIDSISNETPPFYIILKRENGYYKILKKGISSCPAFSSSWKKDIIGSYKPKEIIYMQNKLFTYNAHKISKIKKIFKSEKIAICFPENSEKYLFTTAAEKVQYLIDEKVNQYDVKMCCVPEFEVRCDGNILMKASYTDIVPLEKTVIIYVDSKKSVSLYSSYVVTKPLELLEEIKLSTFKCKKVTVTLKIDINSFYDFKVVSMENIIDNDVMDLTDKCIKTCTTLSVAQKDVSSEKARMIFDRQYFSVSYFTNNKENIIKDSDGSHKTPIYISFTEKKPIIGKDARNMYVEKPECVVFDLIKLCSIKNVDINNPNYEFNLSKEDESIMVTMDTVDGKRKSPVDFLLALILKNGNDRIKKEYGKKMKDIEIGFDGFTPNEIWKKNFIEAGNLLNLNIVFV